MTDEQTLALLTENEMHWWNDHTWSATRDEIRDLLHTIATERAGRREADKNHAFMRAQFHEACNERDASITRAEKAKRELTVVIATNAEMFAMAEKAERERDAAVKAVVAMRLALESARNRFITAMNNSTAGVYIHTGVSTEDDPVVKRQSLAMVFEIDAALAIDIGAGHVLVREETARMVVEALRDADQLMHDVDSLPFKRGNDALAALEAEMKP